MIVDVIVQNYVGTAVDVKFLHHRARWMGGLCISLSFSAFPSRIAAINYHLLERIAQAYRGHCHDQPEACRRKLSRRGRAITQAAERSTVAFNPALAMTISNVCTQCANNVS